MFITLTYDDAHLPITASGRSTLLKEDLVKYIKRLRRDIEPRRLKYFAAGEYGERTDRPHYHAIIFGVAPDDPLLEHNWGRGFVYCGTVSYESARYVASYVYKKYSGDLAKETYGDRLIPFAIQSKGLGSAWAEENEKYIKDNEGITVKGVKMSTPRYYRKKLGIKSTDDHIDQIRVLKAYQVELVMVKNGVTRLEEWKRRNDGLNQTKINLEAKLCIKKDKNKL